MNCLSCGDCCLRMSPLDTGVGCPHLVQPSPGIYACADYENRPEQCANHRFPARVCPIGASVLGLTNPQDVAMRIDAAWEAITTMRCGGGR